MMNHLIPVVVLFSVLATGVAAQNKELLVYYNDRPPLYIVKGETGFLADVTKLVLKEAQIQYRFVDRPSNRILSDIKEGKVYGFGLGWFKKR